MNVPNRGEAQAQLTAAQEAQRRVDSVSARPYGRLLLVTSVAQILLFGAMGVLMYRYWTWWAALLLLAVGMLLSFFVTRRKAMVRTVLPRGAAGLEGLQTRWAETLGIPILIAIVLLAPNMFGPGSGQGSPLVFLVPLLGSVALIPQIRLGMRLWRS